MCSFASWQVRRMVPSCRIHVTRATSDAMRASSYFITRKGAHAKLPVELHVGEGRRKERGGPARKRAVFIVMRRNLGKKAGSANQPQVDDLVFCSYADAAAHPKERVSPSRGPPLMKTTRFLAGCLVFPDKTRHRSALCPFPPAKTKTTQSASNHAPWVLASGNVSADMSPRV